MIDREIPTDIMPLLTTKLTDRRAGQLTGSPMNNRLLILVYSSLVGLSLAHLKYDIFKVHPNTNAQMVFIIVPCMTKC